ncbi:26S proteasome regulatory subunit RPN7, putative, partial [Hepatocystis sp. ex Piliocolobus tephrosceles]
MEYNKEDTGELDTSSYPNFELANLFYLLKLPDVSPTEKNEAFNKLMEEIKKNNMYVYYSYICKELNLDIDEQIYNNLKEKADEELEEIKKKIQESSEDFDSMDNKNDLLLTPNFFCKIGD